MKKKKIISLNKLQPKSDYDEFIVQPAEKLLKALLEAETKEKESTLKIRKVETTISR